MDKSHCFVRHLSLISIAACLVMMMWASGCKSVGGTNPTGPSGPKPPPGNTGGADGSGGAGGSGGGSTTDADDSL